MQRLDGPSGKPTACREIVSSPVAVGSVVRLPYRASRIIASAGVISGLTSVSE